ncbi:MAG TPA: hypothetical protein DCR14_06840 [Acidimicrobiaceae bacterium]|nr:hypothetical protein [Acidimicrobiaceae bacterium]
MVDQHGGGAISASALVEALLSQETAEREAAAAELERSSDPDVPSVLVDALTSKYGYVVRQALDLLAGRADPAALEPLREFERSNPHFDHVVRARVAIDAIEGRGYRRRPSSADFYRLYGSALVLESLTWTECRGSGSPLPDDADLAVVISPSFHPELAVSFSGDQVDLWLRHDSLWQTMQTDSFGATGARRVLTTNRSDVGRLRRLAEQGLEEPETERALDGVRFGGLVRMGGEIVELASRNGGVDLSEFLFVTRQIGMASAEAYWEYELLRELGGYIGVGLEVLETSRPMRAVSIAGRCDSEAWNGFEAARVGRRYHVADVSGLRFLSPVAAARFGRWVTESGAVVVGDNDNPYVGAAGVEIVDSWSEAGENVAHRPTLQLIGYWASGTDASLPHPSDFVDGDAGPGNRAVGDALDRGVPYLYAMGLSPCRICGKPNGAAEMTNGTYVWPEGLSHYVRDHGVVLPSELTVSALAVASGDDRWLTALAAEACDRSLDWWREATSRGGPTVSTGQ